MHNLQRDENGNQGSGIPKETEFELHQNSVDENIQCNIPTVQNEDG